ncbi:CMD domain-containing protein [Rouxiella sp. Mn2063]|uniref:CMD domain-containing protein n=1 Tax=Rouxiella sp. Mn2063 TaxID=3395262 RepID=UPI003BD080D1
MEQQRRTAHNGWYHETQSSQQEPRSFELGAQLVQDRFLLGLDQDIAPSLRQNLQQYSGLFAASRAAYNTLFADDILLSRSCTLSLYDRLSSALTVAQVTGIQVLCSHYAARLAPLDSPDASRESNIRQTHITQFSRLLATQPTSITADMLHQLENVGLSTKDIVTFIQLIGFVSYQARVLAVINAARGKPAAVLPGFPEPENTEQRGFSLQMLQWTSRLTEINLQQATHQQLDALDLSAPNARSSSFYRLLIQDERLLEEYSAIFSHIMRGENGETGLVQELAATTTSRLNGCLYCTGIHARAYLELGGDKQQITRLFDEKNGERYATIGSNVLLNNVAILTRTPQRFDAKSLNTLIASGYDDTQSFKILLTSALFSWANRLIQTLGNVHPVAK